jgi:hypothetical protein
MMSNIVSLHSVQQQLDSPFGQESKLYFPVVERPLAFVDRFDHGHKIETHKALVRPTETQQPHCLAIVGKDYKLVQNKELFQSIEGEFTKAFNHPGAKELQDVKVLDRISYNGQTCFRDYRFPNMQCDIGSAHSEIAFRLIVVNGFGGSSVKIYSGAIDFFCTNGIIHGQFEHSYLRHTKGLTVEGICERVKRSIDVFYKMQDIYSQWVGKPISSADAKKFLEENTTSLQLAAKLLRQFEIECMTHGRTVWALYSALTYYASHNEGEFVVRNTGQDHAAATMLKREESIHNIIETPDFMRLAA